MYVPQGQMIGPWPPPGMPGSPGPMEPPSFGTPVTANMPVSVFPTSGRTGDPVTIVGPFGGLSAHQLRVRFTNSSWQYPTIIGAGQATVTVPRDAETGRIEVEINGRITGHMFTVRGDSPAETRAHKGFEAPWQRHQEYVNVSGWEPTTTLVVVGVAAIGLAVLFPRVWRNAMKELWGR